MKQLDYILGLLNHRRERYKLWWNALTGLVIAFGVGVGISVVSGEIRLSSINQTRFLLILLMISTVFTLLFFIVFFEIHWVDEVEECIILQLYVDILSEISHKLIQVRLVNAIRFIRMEFPTDTWGKLFAKAQNKISSLFIVSFLLAGLAALMIISPSAHFRSSAIVLLIIPVILCILRIIGYQKKRSWLKEVFVKEISKK